MVFVICNDSSAVSESDLSRIRQSEAVARNYERNKAVVISNASANMRSGDNTSSVSTVYVDYNYFSNLTNFGYNNSGTCTVIAACMLFGYFDYYISDTYVPNVYEYGTGTTNDFHELVNDYVYVGGEEGGIFIDVALDGLNEYLSSTGTTAVMEATQRNSVEIANQMIISQLTSGYPVIASMGTNYDAPRNHSVLIHGVTYDSSNPVNTAVYTVHMGFAWDLSTTVYLASAGWFYQCGFITCGLENHVFNGTCKAIDNSYHKSYCHCGAYRINPHMYVTSIGGTVCSVCGRVDTSQMLAIIGDLQGD